MAGLTYFLEWGLPSLFNPRPPPPPVAPPDHIRSQVAEILHTLSLEEEQLRKLLQTTEADLRRVRRDKAAFARLHQTLGESVMTVREMAEKLKNVKETGQ